MRKFLWPVSTGAIGVGILALGAHLGSGTLTSLFLTDPNQLVCETVKTRVGSFTICSMVEETTLWQRLTREYKYYALGNPEGTGRVVEAGADREGQASPSDAPWWRKAITLVTQAAAQQPAHPPELQTSLAQAARVAEQQTGGRAREVELEREGGVYVYEIEIVSKDRSTTVLVDPGSGNVVRMRSGLAPSITRVFDRDDQDAFARLEAFSMTLASAIDAGEKAIGGRPVNAALKRRYGLFEVGILKDWTMHKVLVNPTTGKVVTVPSDGKRN